jgi:hypothetical protein
MNGLIVDPKPKRKARGKPLTRAAFPVERIDRHILFDADILDGLLAAAPSERTQLSGLVNKICEDWLRRRRKGTAE